MGKCFEELTTAEQEFVLRNYVGTVLTATAEVEGMEVPDGTDEVMNDLDAEADFWAMVAAAEWERFEGCFD